MTILHDPHINHTTINFYTFFLEFVWDAIVGTSRATAIWGKIFSWEAISLLALEFAANNCEEIWAILTFTVWQKLLLRSTLNSNTGVTRAAPNLVCRTILASGIRHSDLSVGTLWCLAVDLIWWSLQIVWAYSTRTIYISLFSSAAVIKFACNIVRSEDCMNGAVGKTFALINDIISFALTNVSNELTFILRRASQTFSSWNNDLAFSTSGRFATCLKLILNLILWAFSASTCKIDILIEFTLWPFARFFIRTRYFVIITSNTLLWLFTEFLPYIATFLYGFCFFGLLTCSNFVILINFTRCFFLGSASLLQVDDRCLTHIFVNLIFWGRQISISPISYCYTNQTQKSQFDGKVCCFGWLGLLSCNSKLSIFDITLVLHITIQLFEENL